MEGNPNRGVWDNRGVWFAGNERYKHVGTRLAGPTGARHYPRILLLATGVLGGDTCEGTKGIFLTARVFLGGEPVKDDRYAVSTGSGYAVSTGSGYAVLISLNEYAVLDRKLDTPYPMEVDTPYSAIDQNSIRRIQGLDTAYWGFLGVGTTFDIFQNIHILYLEYGVLSLSGYGVLNFTPLWSLVSAGTDTPYLP
ncbi:hypothetical protein Tco_0359771 [Tanacetum coccineum]